MAVVKHATVAAIETKWESEGGWAGEAVLYLRGSLNGEAFDACFSVDKTNPPFNVGDIVTVTMEVEQ